MTLSDQYRLIVEHLPTGIVFLYDDPEQPRYRFVAGQGLADIGLTKAELEGEQVAADRPPAIKEQLHSRYREALRGNDVSFEIEAEGRHFRFELRPVYDESGDIIAGVGSAQDITEEVVYREELERKNDRLEELTDLVFHDIQTPLNVAEGRLELLREECDSEHVEPLAGALESIHSLTSRDSALIDRVESESLETLGLGQIATVAWQNVATKAADLRIATERDVRASPEELRRMFENLFRNAVEHGGEDVTVTVGRMDDGFFVEDDGEGIPEAERDIVLNQGISRTDQGSGLGLFIVSKVVEAHGWEITVGESGAGGARFEITGLGTSAA